LKKLKSSLQNNLYLKTSNKVPDGFFHRDKVPAIQDSKAMMEAMNRMKK
tara:strand:+ start:324 stop:470 length:147 start_codon:yes stop_codon:yes gene_type:complete